MSEENKQEVESKEEVTQSNESEAPKEDYVPKTAYEEVSSDMHKYKNELKETKASLNQLKAEQEAKEKEALAEQGKWQELYEVNQKELENLKQQREEEKNKFINYHKKNSVLQKIGGFKREDYNKFIDVNNIEMNDDGSLDEKSLMGEVDRIKQEYPELLKSASSTKLPNDAPKGSEIDGKDATKLEGVDKANYLKSVIKDKNK